LVSNTINMLLEGASSPMPSDFNDSQLPLSVALDSPNIHHFLVAGQSSLSDSSRLGSWESICKSFGDIRSKLE
ncbi:MAG TPA: hypothetical protein VJ729_00345, partial [Nitrososphaeraceae archaeon]|nr:hypothetical protein [Nitrososphaeraceae archaeon]